MGLQKYRISVEHSPDSNGAIRAYCNWMGGPTLVLIRNCPIAPYHGTTFVPFSPRTVYVQGEPDTAFSLPAACAFKGKKITGWLGCEGGEWKFHPHTNQ
jgi:hypothetical protein